MWPTDRKIASRGRSPVPRIRFRWRSRMRSRRSFFVRIFMTLGSRLPDLLLQHFAHVAHTLLLVRIGLAHAADVRGNLADHLPVDARHRDVRLLVDDDVDPR